MPEKNIVLIGAGYAGVHAAKKLAKKYKRDESVTITLIDRHSYHTMMTELHEVAGGRVEPTAIQYDLRHLFNRTKVKLVTDNVTHVDHETKTVTTENGSYPFDYLVLGMGGEPNDFGTPGVGEHGFTLWSWENAVKLREHIETVVHDASEEQDVAKRKAMLTFAICGSGFTGIEMVGELLDWKTRLAKDNKVDVSEIELIVVEAAPTILNMLDRKDAQKAEDFMLKKGIKIMKDAAIVEVKAESIVLKSGDEIPTHTLIWTAGVRANSDTKDYGMETARAGRLKVNEYMEAEKFENTYVIGDLAYYEEEEGKPTPQIVEAAEQTGMTAAKSIISEISGTQKEAYNGKYHGVMVSIGSKYGVANLGGLRLHGWFAIFMKHMVNLYYFFGIRSGYYMAQYVSHEFFHIRDNRNIFRGWTSRYGNVLWTLPLRIYVGWFWVDEALSKIYGETTWDKVSLTNLKPLFQGLGPDSWLTATTSKMPFDWLQTAATSGASQAAGDAAGDAATNVTTPILSHMPGWFEWIMKLVMPNLDVALFMQKVVPFVELAIGLALVVGLFTWLASIGSAGFLVMFTLCAMLGWDKFWALPASIALLNGAGRTFGLDYWAMPWLQKHLGRWWYGKESSIYRDK
ncbi:FAD-dependent oxidoreductase [Listeria grandensis]|uniref:NADH:ubiquinone reductase (non-electrogenic) n=1 Tax=Listeria grandensis TaxID=1494963 RepID=A0A7X0Y267_9LIST|nr:FAD-dependent oxidoreductase [Listeria grandensis]MBC1474524.1 FAD-dependent oxidoreductase [Listeria grandensis]MBC1935652.1 FAD-dependent oxidoreductase [Listeria grandensis]MBC6315981.1 FAD-dependent oxidoreductase [Listeria grandensis]